MKTTTTVLAAVACACACALAIPFSVRAAGQDGAPDAAAGDPGQAAVAAALQAAGWAKLAVSERYSKTHAWAHDGAELGFEAPTGVPGRIDIADGAITITFEAPAAPATLAGKTVRLTPSDIGDGMVHWRCDAADLPGALKPEGCE